MEQLIISHTVLYCKGWYKTSSSIKTDFIRCLSADGFCPFINTQDVIDILLNEIRKLEPAISLLQFHDLVKSRLLVNGDDYDTAVLKSCKNILLQINVIQWKVKSPDYEIFPKPDHVNLEILKACFPLTKNFGI